MVSIGNSGRGNAPQWVVRDNDWKLLGNPRDRSEKAPLGPADKLFLVNLKQDSSEMTNLAGDHPDVVKRLLARREEYLRSID